MIGLVVLGVVAVVGGFVALVFFVWAANIKTVPPDVAERTLAAAVMEKNLYVASAVSCPSDVELKVGSTFTCHFNSPYGPETARMQITEVDSRGVPTFDMSWGRG